MKNKIITLGSIILLLLFSSCEVGLGSSVDTEEPNVSITYPPESSVIKGSFILAGSCVDDHGIASIQVTLKNTQTEKIIATYKDEVVIKDDKWTLELNKKGNYNGYELADGRYSVDVFATDTSERISGTASSSFDIDNTAPVLILSKPLAVGTEKATVFGQSIKLAGDISEEHTTTSLTMNIREWDNETKSFKGKEKKISISDFSSMSSDTPLVIAQYFTTKQINNAPENEKSTKTTLREKYLQIYGSINEKPDGSFESSGDKTFYAAIELTDNAKEYRKPGDAGVGSGNVSKYYYINNTDFYNNLMSENAFGLTATKLRKILNKTCTEYDAKQQEKINTILKKFSLSSTVLSENGSKLLINPDNNPLYKVNEYEQGLIKNEEGSIIEYVNKNISSEEELETGYRTLARGSSVNITLEAGNDGFSIDPSTVSIKVYKMNNASDNDIDKKTGDKVWEILKAGDWNASSSTTLGTRIIIENTAEKESFFEGGEYYRVVVEGTDIEGGYLMPACSTGYGFLVNANSNPPELSITTVSGEYISGKKLKDSGKEIELKVTTNGEADSPLVTLQKDGSDISNHISISSSVINVSDNESVDDDVTLKIGTPNVTGPVKESDGRYTYTVKVVVGKDAASVPSAGGEYKYNLTLKVKDSAAKTSTIPFTFYVDNKAPVISNIKVTPEETGKKLNGKITFSADVSDNRNLDSVEYKILVGETDVTSIVSGSQNTITKADGTIKNFGDDVNSPTKEIDTTKLDDEVPIEIQIIAKDHVGNEKIEKITGYTISQASDKPVITPTNFSVAITAKDNVNSKKGNVFDKNSKLIGSVTDTDDIALLECTIKDESNTQKGYVKLENITSGTSFNVSVPTECGYYKVTLYTKDKTYGEPELSDTLKKYRSIKEEFWIAVDNAVPTLTITKIDGSEDNIYSKQYKKGNVKYEGTVSDDWALAGNDAIDVYIDGKIRKIHPDITPDNEAEEIQDITSGAWECTVQLGSEEKEYNIEFVAKDKAGKTKTVSSTVVQDKIPPKFVKSDYITDTTEGFIIKKTENNYKNGWYKDNTIDIEGYIIDAISDIKSVKYEAGESSGLLNIDYRTVGTEKDKKQVQFYGTITNLKDEVNIQVKALDAAGNEVTSSKTIRIDTIEPSITLTHYKESKSGNYKDLDGIIGINGTKDLYLKGTVSDAVPDASSSGLSGVTEIYFRCNSQADGSEDTKLSLQEGVTDWEEYKLSADTLKKGFGDSSTSGNIYALVKDKAGNTTSVPLVSVVYDIDYPKAEISAVKYAGTQNKIKDANKRITFEGIAHDNQVVKSVQLEYSAGKDKNGNDTSKVEEWTWTPYGDPEETNVNSWEITVDTEAKDKANKDLFTDGKIYYFRAVATDSYGNTGNTGSSGKACDTEINKLTKIKINQSSDIPEIIFSNVSIDPEMGENNRSWLLKTNDIFVSASDDDGFSKIEYITDSGDNPEWITVTNGKINLNDGQHNIRFKVTDNAGTEFISNTALAPVLKDSKNENKATKGILYLAIDKIDPDVDVQKYYIWDGTKYPAEDEATDSSSSIKFGGIHNKLKIKLEASDANGIQEVYASHGSKTWPATCSDASYNDSIAHTWTLVIEDSGTSKYLKNLSTGTTEFTITVVDGAGNKKEKKFNLRIDNTPAVLEVDSHAKDDLVGKDFILKGIVKEADSKTKIKYLINHTETEITDWSSATEYEGSASSWRLYIGGADADGENHTEGSLKELFVREYGASKRIGINDGKIYKKDASGRFTNELYTDVQPLVFHFLVTDEVGNPSTTTFTLKVDPQGDLPKVKMTYPVATNIAENSVTLSGRITASGEAEAISPKSVIGVYMQIDVDYDSNFKENVWKKTAGNDPIERIVSPSLKDGENFKKLSDIYTIENIYAKYNGQPGVTPKQESTSVNNEYAIYIGNKTSWNLTINGLGELNGLNKAQQKIAVRLLVVDSSGIVTRTDPLIITVDSDSPIFDEDNLYVYQYAWVNKSNRSVVYSNTKTPVTGATLYSDSGCKNPSDQTYSNGNYTANFASVRYTDDMSLKGEWWLHATVEDDSDIYEIVDESSNYRIVLNDGSGNLLVDTDTNPKSTVKVYDSPAGNRGFEFNLRVGSTEENSFGKKTYKIKATESTPKDDGTRGSTEKIFTINYDNKPPVVDDENSGSSYFNINKNVANSYGFYKLGTAAYEDGYGSNTQSGFARAVVYFTKSSKVYDTYIKKGSTGNAVATTDLTNTNGLYWQSTAVSSISGNNVEIAATNTNIHKGGLVLLGGSYYTVTNVSGNTITLNGQPAEDLRGAPIYFAIGHVIDTKSDGSSKEETDGTTIEETENEYYGYYKNADSDDDYMVENVIVNGSRTTWSGSINSNNMPDGPAELHYVVFDAAGNYTEKTLNVLVGNNAPRLASVKVWCNYDGSKDALGNITENENGSETLYYYYSERKRRINGKTVSKATDVTSRLIVTGTEEGRDVPFMKVKDDVTFIPEIVGGNGKLYYSYNISNSETTTGTESAITEFGSGHDDGNIYISKAGTYLITDDEGNKYINGHNKYGFTIEKSELSSNTGDKYFNFTIRDGGKDGDGSDYKDIEKCLSATMQVRLQVMSDAAKPKVNVFRFYKDDITAKTKYLDNLYGGSLDNGHIELEDDLSVALKALGNDPKVSGKIVIHGTAYDDIRLKTLKIVFTEHNQGTKKINSAATAATYTNGIWVSESTDIAANGWAFEATDRYNNADGHLVDWTCSIDTSFIQSKAKQDCVFKLVATDDSNKSSEDTPSGDDETKIKEFHRPTYQMDVVPYIRRVRTSLSSHNSSNPSVYDRSSSGHYPVYITYSVAEEQTNDSETIELIGFNFNKGNTGKTITLSSSYSSGPIPDADITVNEIKAINNINDNTISYNKQANGVNNDRLTDDVYLDVWKINNKAADPGNNLALDMSMGINQTNGMIGFGFLRGRNFSMPTAKASYSNYDLSRGASDLVRCASFTYDKLGYAYGNALPGNENDAYNFVTSRWKAKEALQMGSNQSGTQDKDRYQSTSYATYNTSAEETTVYTVFFDQINGTIRLRSGIVKGDGTKGKDGTNYKTDNKNSNEGSILIANADGTDCLGKAGEYVSVGVTSTNHVVITWYAIDNGKGKLMYAYYNKAGSPSEARTSKLEDNEDDTDYWTVTQLLDNGGKYCKLAVDNEDNVHIAAYDVLNADLKYYYLSANGTLIKSATVDSYLTIGQNITLDVAQKAIGETNYQIPYIGYWGTYPKRPRYAFLVNPAATGDNFNGVDSNGKYTGTWECTIVPSKSEIYIDDNTPWRVNVGVWKDSLGENGSGVLKNSTSTATTATACYGNGTNNGVISYLRVNKSNNATNFVETAQILGTPDYTIGAED